TRLGPTPPRRHDRLPDLPHHPPATRDPRCHARPQTHAPNRTPRPPDPRREDHYLHRVPRHGTLSLARTPPPRRDRPDRRRQRPPRPWPRDQGRGHHPLRTPRQSRPATTTSPAYRPTHRHRRPLRRAQPP